MLVRRPFFIPKAHMTIAQNVIIESAPTILEGLNLSSDNQIEYWVELFLEMLALCEASMGDEVCDKILETLSVRNLH